MNLEVQDATQFLADEEVIGTDVVNVRDEKVGTIADLVVDQDQKLVGAVLSVGGFLGIGEKWVAIPVDQIAFPSEDQPARLLIAVTEEQLQNAPDFKTRDEVEAQAAVDQAQQQAMEQPADPLAGNDHQAVVAGDLPDRRMTRVRQARVIFGRLRPLGAAPV